MKNNQEYGMRMSRSVKIEPIKPSDIAFAKSARIPEEVIKVFNNLIARYYSNGRAVVKQSHVISALWTDAGISKSDIYSNHYLDIEEIYRDAGWQVEYDKPGHNEGGEARFIFLAVGMRK